MSALLAFNYPVILHLIFQQCTVDFQVVFTRIFSTNWCQERVITDRKEIDNLLKSVIFWIKTCQELGDYWCVAARANLDWFVCVLSAIKPLICPWEETGTECNDMSDFPLGWLLGSQGTVSSEAKQPFSRSVLSQRKVTINDFFTLQSVSSPLLPSVTTLGLDDEGSLELTIKRFTMWQSC